LTFCTYDTQVYRSSQWVKTKWGTQYKQRLFPTVCFHASCPHHWNAAVARRDKQILPPILGHTWWRILPTAWRDYAGNVLVSVYYVQMFHD
jgi:hypothetical protein